MCDPRLVGPYHMNTLSSGSITWQLLTVPDVPTSVHRLHRQHSIFDQIELLLDIVCLRTRNMVSASRGTTEVVCTQ